MSVVDSEVQVFQRQRIWLQFWQGYRAHRDPGIDQQCIVHVLRWNRWFIEASEKAVYRVNLPIL